MYWWNFTWNFIACTTVVHVKHLSIAFIDKIYTGDTISHVHIENSLWILNEFDKNSKPRLCLLRRRGRQSSRGVPTYNFAKTFQKQRMKLKTFWAVGGRAPGAPPYTRHCSLIFHFCTLNSLSEASNCPQQMTMQMWELREPQKWNSSLPHFFLNFTILCCAHVSRRKKAQSV